MSTRKSAFLLIFWQNQGMRFDGNSFAAKIEEDLVVRLKKLKRKPKLVIVRMGDDEASKKYVERKKEVGERIGIEIEVIKVESPEGVRGELKSNSQKNEVDGLMVQLPLANMGKEEVEETLGLIALEKDVDGLNPKNLELLESGEQSFVPATVKAVEKILDEAFRYTSKDIDENLKVAVVGAKGMVGRGVAARMRRFGMQIREFEEGDDLGGVKEADVVISAVGKENLISPARVKQGVIVIDVGFPKGDFDPEVEKQAEFFTPVPGGVGPVTVISLLENVVWVVENEQE